jgi:hypothetical protein
VKHPTIQEVFISLCPFPVLARRTNLTASLSHMADSDALQIPAEHLTYDSLKEKFLQKSIFTTMVTHSVRQESIPLLAQNPICIP